MDQAVVLLGFSAAALAPIAVRFDFALGGFLAVLSAFNFAGCSPLARSMW